MAKFLNKSKPSVSLPIAQTFFETIYKNVSEPAGYLILWELKNKRSHSFHHSDLASAGKVVEDLARQDDIYFSPGLQREPLNQSLRGKQDGVGVLPGFWFDFDLWNPERKKNNLKSQYPLSREALFQFTDKYLPEPTVLIDTGGGFHAHWILDSPLVIASKEDYSEAVALSKDWQNRIIAYGRQMGWNLDNTSSIEHAMRIPGTMNHKYGTVVTRIDRNPHYHSLSDIKTLLQESEKREVTRQPLDPNLLNLVSDCAFLKHCDEDAVDLAEPHWHMMVCILANQERGPEMIHQLSRKYHSYKQEETDQKIRNALKNNPAPITCNHLKSIYNCGKDCNVASPIHLLRKSENIDNSKDELDIEAIENDIAKSKIPDTSFPWDVFPEPLVNCLTDLSRALSVPNEMTAVMCLSMISTSIGSSLAYVQAKRDYTVPTNIWLGIIGETGHKKTPALEKMLEPVYQHQKSLYDAAMAAAGTSQMIQGSSGKAVKAPAATVRFKSVFTTDSTMEALLTQLCENPKGLILYHDELSGFFKSFDKYRLGKGGDREQYLSLWSGSPIKVDRTGKQLYCHRPCLSILGGIQPRLAAKAFGTDSFDDGLLPRFLFFQIPSERPPLTTHEWASANKEYWKVLISHFYNLKAESIQLHLDQEAQNRFLQVANSLQRLGDYSSYRLRVFMPKMENYVLRLSGLLHMLHQHDRGEQPISDQIQSDTLEKAVKLAKFFLAQARKVVELYAPRKIALDKTQEGIIDAIISTISKSSESWIAVSEIMNTFNGLVPTEGRIEDPSTFGTLMAKVLNKLKIEFTKKRRPREGIGVKAMHLEITKEAEKMLKACQKDYKV